MPFQFSFDFRNPDYNFVWEWRYQQHLKLKNNPQLLKDLKVFYKSNPAQFIIDWGVTSDPRNVERGLPVLMPFLLLPKQEDWVHWLMDRWHRREPGIVEKSRECGLSWLTVSVAATLCLFHEGMNIGFGSRKEEYVDKKGDPKSLLWKARQFISYLPKEFREDWDERKHSPYMRIEFPNTGSVITGESGDGIGRGARTSITFVDEAAFIPRSDLLDASLSQTTNCRIDVSTPRGMNNSFARRRFGGKINVFTFHWTDDLRKDQAWYEKMCHDIDDPVVIAQEIDLDYSASIEGILIPAIWVQSSLDAHLKLNIRPTGIRKAGIDVADEGIDKNSLCARHGILVEHLESWSGKGSDIYDTVERAFRLCDELNINTADYDADGLGAGVRGDAKVINRNRQAIGLSKIDFNPFRGSGAVVDPEGNPFKSSIEIKDREPGRTNEDFFANAKAQAWWSLRRRFQLTYRAVVEQLSVDPADIISISSNILDYKKLIVELSQPTYSQNNNGKILVDKQPPGCRSPNLADSLVICFAPIHPARRSIFMI